MLGHLHREESNLKTKKPLDLSGFLMPRTRLELVFRP